jgi:hypothetical protein
MNAKRYLLHLSIYSLLLYSCRKGELPVPAHDPGNVVTATVNMEANYKWQLFYSLKTNIIVSKNLKTAWDLGFTATPDGYSIILNTSKAMFAYNTQRTGFSEVSDTNGFAANKKWDNPNGDLDSTAIGNWQPIHPVYIIDRGYNEMGIHQGFRKVQFQQADAYKYTIRIASMNGANDATVVINKDSNYNFAFLSLTTNQPVMIEPPKAAWDLVFTQYTHIFNNPLTTYLVTGCLLNRFNTCAVKDSISSFTAITYNTATRYALVPAINTIGYDWKTYTGSTYITNTKINYIIRNSEGVYYKLHFIDFFNTMGVKGNPKWEFQQL